MLIAWSSAVATGIFTLLGATIDIALGGALDYWFKPGVKARRSAISCLTLRTGSG
jgi:hypothetical protein